jgi:hypothetical protein
MPEALNTGILGDGLRLIDLDIDDSDLAERAADVLFRLLGEAPVRFRRNSPRRCIVYRAATGEPSKRSIVGDFGKAEILGHGQQVLAFGQHPTGAELEWTISPAGQIARTDLPAVTEDQITMLLTALAPLIGAPPKPNGSDSGKHIPGEPQADIDRISAAMARIPNNTGPPDWEGWNRIGMALFAATNGSADGHTLWHEWSSKHPSYDPASTEARWQNYLRFPPSVLGAGSIFRAAQEAERERMTDWLDPGPAASARPQGQPEPDPWAATSAQPQVQAEPASQPPPSEVDEDDWPEPMELAAFHGLLGAAVGEIMPHTEADPHGLLLQLLAFVGNTIGRGPHYRVGPAQHATNIYLLLAGATSRARKGTAEAEVRALFAVDTFDQWLTNSVQAGLSSGEGLVHAVRDERWGRNKKGEAELLDEGVAEKRLLVVESEFASVLTVMRREGNTLSPVLRVAWDRGTLQTMTRNSPLKATGALISLVGHTTIDELRSGVDRIALTNGLLNRFLFAVVRRARLLPHGSRPDQVKLQQIGEQLGEAVRAARLVEAVHMTDEAAALWTSIYPVLTADHPGLFGSLIARAEAHVMRLALLYALADQRQSIEPVHLQAALAVWKFSETSARVLFGDMIGDPVADTILQALKDAGSVGMSRRDLILLFNRNVDAGRIQRALHLLSRQGRARRSTPVRPGMPGRPAEVWHFIPAGTRP